MIESMTGFATLDVQKDGYELNLSLRSVNSRYLETRVRLPASLTYYDGLFKEAVKKRITRGKIDIEVNLANAGQLLETIKVDTEAVMSVRKELSTLKSQLQLDGEVSLETLSRVMGNQMFRTDMDKESLHSTLSIIMEAVNTGLDKLIDSRRDEGSVLKEDLLNGLEKLSHAVEMIDQNSQGLVEASR